MRKYRPKCVAALKAALSHYLEVVEGGEQVLVTSHGKEIAKIGPACSSHVAPINWAAFLKEHPPIKSKVKGKSKEKGEDVVTLIRKIRDEA